MFAIKSEWSTFKALNIARRDKEENHMAKPVKRSDGSAFEPAVRYNWGFHDGQSARRRNNWPAWCRSWQNMALAHFDKAYGSGFHEGWHGYRHAETSTAVKAEKYRNAIAA